jgi:uncharacterized protein (TIGR02270 family)
MIIPISNVPLVVQQHHEAVSSLYNQRTLLVKSSHPKLIQIRRLDERLAANLDALLIAGNEAQRVFERSLSSPIVADIFSFSALALVNKDMKGLDRVLSLAETLPETSDGLQSALRWVSSDVAYGFTQQMLNSNITLRKLLGLASCAAHEVTPESPVVNVLNSEASCLRSCALGLVATLALLNHLPACLNALTDEDPDCAYQAARAAVLLGDRGASIAALRRIALAPSPRRSRALRLLLKLQSPSDAHATLKALAQDPACVRLLIQGVGTAGDSHYVPWLIQQMQDLKLSRLAGESFSFITGLDLAYLDLERKPPEGVDFGPNDDPNDDNVAMDEDDGLPWPDVEKITAWWEAHGHRFAPGTRYFMGEPPSSAHCLDVLKNGFQRQRMAAAIYLCLLKPGTPLFNCAAPAWRQQRLLAKMVA